MLARGAALLFALAAAGCGTQPRAGTSSAPGARSVAERRSDEHPPLVLVERLGDPYGGAAFAATHDGGASVSATLAALIGERLEARGVTGLESRVSSLGFTLSAPVRTPAESAAFVTAASAALAEPLRANEPGIARARAAIQSLAAKRFPGRASAAAGLCSGELGAFEGNPALSLETAGDIQRLGAWLGSVRTLSTAAFGAVGPPAVLSATETALLATEAWPKGALVKDPWPTAGEIGAEFSAALPRRLTLAVRVSSPGVALQAADGLADPTATLARRLEALAPDWHLERAVAVTRPRGACLRVDLLPEGGDAGPDAGQVARALAVLAEEVERELVTRRGATKSGRLLLDDALLRPTSPGEAAAAAAWRALVDRLPGEGAVRFFAYQGPEVDRRGFDLGRAQERLRAAYAKPNLELVSRVEQGQAGFWALIGSRCGTGLESAADAGEAAWLMTALGRSGPRDGVEFEPWISTDGVGLLAHAIRRTPTETSAQQALRVARALADLVTTHRPTPGDKLRARDALIEALGGSRRPGLAYVLRELSDEHPSWLEPRGTIESLSQASSRGYEGALHRFLATPLRVAVLANGDATQAERARRELERWLIPVRGELVRCPMPPARAPAPARELTLSTSPGELAEGAYFAAPLPRFSGRLPIEARATLFLLNRNGGLLDRTLGDLPAAGSALALGGPRAAALVIQLAAPEDKRSEAQNRLKQAIAGLGRSPVTEAEIALAARELAAEDARARQDPRRRIVDLWRGEEAGEKLDRASLGRYQAALAAAPELVIRVEPHD